MQELFTIVTAICFELFKRLKKKNEAFVKHVKAQKLKEIGSVGWYFMYYHHDCVTGFLLKNYSPIAEDLSASNKVAIIFLDGYKS